LSNELKIQIDYGLTDLMDRESFNDVGNKSFEELFNEGSVNVLKKAIDYWADRINELVKLSGRSKEYMDWHMVFDCIKKLKNELNPIGDMYYFVTYYWPLITNGCYGNSEI